MALELEARPSGFFGFPGRGGKRGRGALLGQGEGLTPWTRRASLPPRPLPDLGVSPSPQVLGPSQLLELSSPSWEAFSEYLMVGSSLPSPEVPGGTGWGGLWLSLKKRGRGGARARVGGQCSLWLPSCPVPPPPFPQLHFSPRRGAGPGGRAGQAGNEEGPAAPTTACICLSVPRAAASPAAPSLGAPRSSQLLRQELLELVTSRLSP